MADQSGNGGAKWQWRSRVALVEQNGNGGAKWQWRRDQSGDAAAKWQVSSKHIASVGFSSGFLERLERAPKRV